METSKTYFEIEAGSLPYRLVDGKIEYLLIYRQNMNDYSFPKGHVEDKESLEDCAVRETFEEAGVSGNIKDFIEAFEYKVPEKRKDGTKFFAIRRVYNYLVEVTNQDHDFINPDKVEGLTIALWLPYEEAYDKLSYPSTKQVLTKGNKMLTSVNKSIMEISEEVFAKTRTALLNDTIIKSELTHLGTVGSFNDREMVKNWSDLDIFMVFKCDNSGNINPEVILQLKKIHQRLTLMYPFVEMSFLTHTLNDFRDYVAFGYLINYQYAEIVYTNSHLNIKQYIQEILNERKITENVERRYSAYKMRHMRFNLIRMVASLGDKSDKSIAKLVIDRIVESAIFTLSYNSRYLKTKKERLDLIMSVNHYSSIKDIYEYTNSIRNRWAEVKSSEIEDILKTGLDNLSVLEAFFHKIYPEPTPEELINVCE